MTLISAATAENKSSIRAIRTPLGEVMKFEVLINEKSQIWIFHDTILPYRLAWIEFDPTRGTLDLISHDMRSSSGILYADVPPTLSTRICRANLVYLYLTDGDNVTGFQKVPMRIRTG